MQISLELCLLEALNHLLLVIHMYIFALKSSDFNIAKSISLRFVFVFYIFPIFLLFISLNPYIFGVTLVKGYMCLLSNLTNFAFQMKKLVLFH